MPEIPLTHKFNIKQQSFFDNEYNYFCALVGGYGSGKTFILCWKALKYAMKYPKDRHLFLCLDYSKAKRVALPILLYKILAPAGIKYKVNQSELILSTEYNTGDGGIYFKSAVNPEKLVSYEYRTASVDEPSLMDEEMFNKLIARVRGKEGDFHQINFALTWDRVPYHWTYKKFWETPINDLAVYRAPTRLNIENVGSEYIRILSSVYSPEMAKNYLEGFPVNLNQNLIYWAFNREKHVRKDIEYSKLLPIGVSYDFNKNPMTITIVQWTKNESHAIDEIIDNNSNTQKATEKVMAKLFSLDPQIRDVYVYGDPTGHYGDASSNYTNYQIINKILGQKYRVFLEVSRNTISVEGRFSWINRLLTGAEDIKIYISNRCINLIKDYETMRYKEGSESPDKTDPARSHSSDNHDYYLYQRFPVRGVNLFSY